MKAMINHTPIKDPSGTHVLFAGFHSDVIEKLVKFLAITHKGFHVGYELDGMVLRKTEELNAIARSKAFIDVDPTLEYHTFSAHEAKYLMKGVLSVYLTDVERYDLWVDSYHIKSYSSPETGCTYSLYALEAAGTKEEAYAIKIHVERPKNDLNDSFWLRRGGKGSWLDADRRLFSLRSGKQLIEAFAAWDFDHEVAPDFYSSDWR